jgi:thioredoxin-like negative regulator of GroEL
MKAISSSKPDSKGDPHQWIARAVTAEMEAEAARKMARLAKDKYKQARKVFKEARRKAKQARKKAKSAARTFGAAAGQVRKPQGSRANSRTPTNVAYNKGKATPLRSSSIDQMNQPVPPVPTAPPSIPAP